MPEVVIWIMLGILLISNCIIADSMNSLKEDVEKLNELTKTLSDKIAKMEEENAKK